MATTSGLTCRSLWSSSQCLARAVRSSPSIRCHRGLATTTRDIYSPDQLPPRYQGMRYGSEAQSDPHSVSTLVQSLRHYLGPKRGIQGTNSEIVHLKSLMARCQPGAEEWKRYGRVDPSRSYTRLHVDDVNGKCNLVRCFGIQVPVSTALTDSSYSSSGMPEPSPPSIIMPTLYAS